MLRIFLDANIYVRLFEVLQFRSLLDTLRDLRPHILVTERIVAEVERTKLTAAKRFFTSQLGKIFVTRAEIPDLLRESVSGDLRKIIRRADTRVRNLNTIRQDVEAVVSATLDAIGENRDPISLELEGLFATAKAPSAAELNRARDRREQGDPPGKPNNPLGDQISWEQLLETVGSGDEVWVGSGDDDFTLESSKTHALLHPRLRRELLARTNVAPLAFRTLADVGTAFRRKNPRASTHIPTAEALDRARLQERAADQLSLSDGIGGRSDLTGTVDVNSMLRAALSQLPAGVLYGETEWVPQPPTEEFAKAIAALVAEKKGSNKK